jgi:hypothetical protein
MLLLAMTQHCGSTGNALSRVTAMTVCLLYAVTAINADSELRLGWVDLSSRIGGHQIALDLPDGSHLTGRVLAVRADSIEILASGDKRSIPRASVHQINLETKSRNTKLIGAGVGGAIVAGSAGGGYATQDYSGAAVAIIGAAIGIGVIITSLFIGHSARKTTTLITVIE